MKMKLILATFCVLFCCMLNVSGQKVKLADDKIFVDKAVKYTFKSPLNAKGKEDKQKATLKDLDGKVILEVRDTVLYLTKLPYEKTARAMFHAYSFTAPQLGKSRIALPKKISFIKNDVVNVLENLGAFTEPTITAEMFDKLMLEYYAPYVKTIVETIPGINERRVKNAAMSEKMFGTLKMRTNSDFIEEIVYSVFGQVSSIADFHKAGIVKKEGTGYSFYNSNDKKIAFYTNYGMKAGESRVQCYATDSGKTFEFKVGETIENILSKVGQYLVTEGYL